MYTDLLMEPRPSCARAQHLLGIDCMESRVSVGDVLAWGSQDLNPVTLLGFPQAFVYDV